MDLMAQLGKGVKPGCGVDYITPPIKPFSRAGVGKLKCQSVSISGFAGRLVTAATTQVYHCGTKAAFENTSTRWSGYVSIKLYYKN